MVGTLMVLDIILKMVMTATVQIEMVVAIEC